MKYLLSLLLVGLFSFHKPTPKPNILIIYADDLGYGDVSAYKKGILPTPNIDKLASQGMKFMNAYAGASLCTPTRVSFMTGRYPARIPVGSGTSRQLDASRLSGFSIGCGNDDTHFLHQVGTHVGL